MCGIAGQVSIAQRDGGASLTAMLEAMVHRGPDGEGRHVDGNLVMGMRRLSIVDLGNGWQPLYNEDRSVALVANAEIYNYVELRSELEARGHVFRSGSDCETIVHLYEEHGLDFVRHLRGMFAFALWDSRERRLILARDRMGEKPLYIVEGDGVLTFASEMKAMLASGAVGPELDGQALAEFFHYGFVIEPRTPFVDVRKLEPAQMLIVELDPWHIRRVTYWDPFAVAPIRGDADAILGDMLDEVGRLTVRADVPVGVALSGGVDSSLVACLAGAHLNGELTAISVGYPSGGANDETAAARWLAERRGWRFIRAEVSDEEATQRFDEVIAGRDDPIADISGIGYARVNEVARDAGIPVVLFGQGGDELFWGYRWVRAAALVNRSLSGLDADRSLPYQAVLRPASISPLDLARWAVRERFGLRPRARIAAAKSLARGASVLFSLHDGFMGLFDRYEAIFTADFAASIDAGALLSPLGSRLSALGGDMETLRLLFSTYLLQNGLAQGDRLSMRASVEARIPLVDYRLVETVIGLKKAYPDLHKPAKWALQGAARRFVPQEVFDRPKRGFAPPARRWFAAMSNAYGERLAQGRLVSLGVLDPHAAERLASGVSDLPGAFPMHYKALVLESWIRIAEQHLGRRTTLRAGRSPEASAA